MVQACCEKCYVHYINEDGTIDKEFLQKSFGKDSKVVVEDDLNNPFIEIIKKHGQRTPKITYVISNGNKKEICTCPCHVKGSVVFH